jgi:hypothetical protein
VSASVVRRDPAGRESYFGLGSPLQSRTADISAANHLRLASLAMRSLVRFLAAASEAFLARAERSAAVIFFAAVFPPSAPVLRAISAIAAQTAAGILIATISILHLRAYGKDLGD